jgi:glutaredoxin
LGEAFTRDELIEMFPNARTFPQVKIDGIAIGGYKELYEQVG